MIITKSDNIEIKTTDLQFNDLRFKKNGDDWMIRGAFPISKFDMKFSESQYRINFNLDCKKKIGINAFQCIAEKSTHNQYAFLKLHENTGGQK